MSKAPATIAGRLEMLQQLLAPAIYDADGNRIGTGKPLIGSDAIIAILEAPLEPPPGAPLVPFKLWCWECPRCAEKMIMDTTADATQATLCFTCHQCSKQFDVMLPG